MVPQCVTHTHVQSDYTSSVQPVHVVTRACDHMMLPSSLSWPQQGVEQCRGRGREGGEACWALVRRTEHRGSASCVHWHASTCPTPPHTLTCLTLAHVSRSVELNIYQYYTNILCWLFFFYVARVRVHYTGCNERGQRLQTSTKSQNCGILPHRPGGSTGHS